MSKINIRYSEDFRENRIASDVYGILRDKGFDPIFVSSGYTVDSGVGLCIFTFPDKTKLPNKEGLESMFEGIPLQSIEIS